MIPVWAVPSDHAPVRHMIKKDSSHAISWRSQQEALAGIH